MRSDLIASLLVHARRAREPLVVPDRAAVKTDAVAYRVQDKVYAKLWPGTLPAAWKVGAPSDKVEPAAAPIPPELMLASPARAQAAALHLVGVEAEVAYRLSRDLPRRANPWSDEEIAAAVGEVVVTIELCGTRLANWKDAPAGWKLADFQSNGALVIGTGTRDWRAIDWKRQEVEFRIGDRVSKAGRCAPVRRSVTAAAVACETLRRARRRAEEGRPRHHRRMDGARAGEAGRRGGREVPRDRRSERLDPMTATTVHRRGAARCAFRCARAVKLHR
ncbi:MAG: hypothetical protein RML56_01025 [Burkholderiales bacterium]|nr:hypothetical protein [Burkholderiales bacterium]